MASSPGSSRLARHASIPAEPVPLTGRVRRLRVPKTVRSRCAVSATRARNSGSRCPSTGRLNASTASGYGLDGPGPRSNRSECTSRSCHGLRTVGAMDSLRGVQQWPVDAVAVAVIDTSGAVVGSHGPQDRPFRLASVTKLLSAYAVLLAVQEGALELDEPAGPPGATVRLLLAHASGLAYDTPQVSAAPGTKRICSNTGFETLADAVASSSGIAFPDYLADGLLRPLGMSETRLTGSAGSAAAG